MVNKIKIKQYRKLKDTEFTFSKGINIVSGTNGTCKTSLLHIISNSFQKIKKTNSIVKDVNCIDIINNINSIMNPKIETLTKGDKTYNDPAKGVSGALFSITYFNDLELDFRRHNSKTLLGKNRFSIKPAYKKGNSEKLPEMPVIYLGLSRLYAFGEYSYDENIKHINKKLPEEYLKEINDMYNWFTGIEIHYKGQENMGDIKTRAEFSSQYEGIDSNTISAGEDNLFIIITALVSLKYYYECINSTREVESILLIDEIDATLHPAFQIKLLNKLIEFSEAYKIQIAFTTHSFSLLEESLNKKLNVIYLIDNIDSVVPMEDIDIYKIKMNLKNVLKEDIYINRKIPIFTEDAEARLFLECIFDYFEKEYKSKFSTVRTLFHLVNTNISCESLKNIFADSNLLRSTMRSICILDGDQESNWNNYTITLPGKKAPEEVIFEHAETLFKGRDDFWFNSTVQGSGYTKVFYRDNIKPMIDGIDIKIKEKKEKDGTSKGVKRVENKKVFNKYKKFFIFVIRDWINCKENKNQINDFYKGLKVMFKKVSEFHDINSKEWID